MLEKNTIAKSYRIVWKLVTRIGQLIGSLIHFAIISILLAKLGVNIYLAPLLAWLIIIVLPKVSKPRGNMREGMEKFLHDKSRARSFSKTAVLIFLFSLLANENLRVYFWIIAALNLCMAALILFKQYKTIQA